jgi:hypothetical protein
MKILPGIFFAIEVGQARPLVRIIPLVIVLAAIIGLYNMKIYKGLNDAQSMDNAQLARQFLRHEGFTTFFIRPYALMQVSAYKASKGQGELFPDVSYPAGAPRAIPDTYNSPGFPVVLAGYFKVLGIDFDETTKATSDNHGFGGDRFIPLLNQLFILLTAGVVFVLGYRLFDERVAWMASVIFLFSDFVWKYSLLATPANLLMLLMTLLFFGLVELYRLGEDNFVGEPRPFGWAWLIVPGLGVLFGLIGLLCLPLLIVMLPIIVYLALMRRTNGFFLPIFAIIAGLMVAPWFYHWYRACGNPLGSNLALGLYGQGEYTGNQVFCNLTIPNYTSLFSGGGSKEYTGFLWYFQRGWDLLGANPMVLLFAASLLHEFRRNRVQAFRWLVVGSAFAIVALTNLAYPQPDPVGAWNLVVVLLPAMILIGSAFFFTLLDRLITQLPLLTISIVVAAIALSIAPMLLVFSSASYAYYNYPPYLPPYLSFVTRLAKPDQWVTTDMPWATAWYGDRASLWLPETTADFTKLNDDFCESDFILFTPVTLTRPMTTMTSGEMKDWFPVIMGRIPDEFPLHHYSKLPAGGPEYTIISNALGSSGGGH